MEVVVDEATVTEIEVVEVVTVDSDVTGTEFTFLPVPGLGVGFSTIVGGGGGGVLSTWIGTGRIRAVNFYWNKGPQLRDILTPMACDMMK